MKSITQHLLITLAVCSWNSIAQELITGPKPGMQLTSVSVYASSGEYTGREFDAAAEIGDAPGALLFIHDLSRNTAPVIRGLDELAAKYKALGFKSFSIILSADRTQAETQLNAVNGSLKLENPIVLSLNGAEGPGNYALNRKCTLSLILVDKGKVQKSIALTDTGAQDIPEMEAWIQELTGPLPANDDEWKKLFASRLPSDREALEAYAVEQSMEIQRLKQKLQAKTPSGRGMDPRRMRRMSEGMQDGNAARRRESAAREAAPEEEKAEVVKRDRQGKPPEDPELNQLLRSFIRKTNSPDVVKEIHAAIQARAKESEALTKEAVEMFKLMLSFRDRYGTETAIELAENFLKDHNQPIP